MNQLVVQGKSNAADPFWQYGIHDPLSVCDRFFGSNRPLTASELANRHSDRGALQRAGGVARTGAAGGGAGGDG